jgi:hypothetical protein
MAKSTRRRFPLNIGRQIVIAVVGIAVGAFTLGVVFLTINNTSMPEPPADSIQQTESSPNLEGDEEVEPPADGGSILVEVDLSICGEYPSESGATKTSGTDANPALLIRGGEKTTIPICIRSTDSVPRTLHFMASDIDSPFEPPKHGINVAFDKTTSTVSAFNKTTSKIPSSSGGSYSSLSPVVDVINVFVTLDSDAELGEFAFEVRAQYEIENNNLVGIGKPVYVRISN